MCKIKVRTVPTTTEKIKRAMSIRYRVNRARSLVTVILENSFSAQDYARFRRDLARDSIGSATRMRQLILISDRLAALSTEQLARLVARLGKLTPATSARQAVVAFTDLHFGQARACLTHLDLSDEWISLFRDIGDALDWLGYRDRTGRIELQTLLQMR